MPGTVLPGENAACSIWAKKLSGFLFRVIAPTLIIGQSLCGQILVRSKGLQTVASRVHFREQYRAQGYPSEPTSLRQGVSRQGRLARGRSKPGGWPRFPGGAVRTVFGLERAISCW